MDRAHLLVGPGGVEHLPAIGAEARLVFVHAAAAGEPLRGAVGQRFAPQLAERVEHQGAAIGRGGHIADHARVERAFRQLLGKVQRLGDHLLHLGGEWHLGGLAAGHVHLPQAALGPDHHRIGVGHPVEAGVRPEDRPGFLLVMAQAIPHRAHLAAGQIKMVQHALVAHALDEGQRAAIRRHLRTHRAARAVHHVLVLAGLPVEALDRVDHPVRVTVVVERAARAHILRVVHVAAIGRHARLADVLLVVGLFHQLDAGAGAAGVVQPQLARAQRAARGEVLAGHDVLAIGRPGGVVEQAEALVGHLARVAAVGGNGPDVVATAAVGGEGDAAAVRRPARLDIPGAAAADAGGGAAGDRHAVQVAQQREHDRAPVGRHVHVHPGALAGLEAHRPGLALGGFHAPLAVVLGRVRIGAHAAGAFQRRLGRIHAGRVQRVLLQFDVVALLLLLLLFGRLWRGRRILGDGGERGERAGQREGEDVAGHTGIRKGKPAQHTGSPPPWPPTKVTRLW